MSRPKTSKSPHRGWRRWTVRFLRLVFLLGLMVIGLAAYGIFMHPLEFAPSPHSFDVKTGSSMKTIARDLRDAGLVPLDWPFVIMARVTGRDRNIQAGNYEFDSGLTPWQLFQKLTEGDVTQEGLTIVEGWTFAQLRAAVRADPGIRQTLQNLTDAEVLQRVGAAETHPEGLFFPDTYFFALGTTDVALLKRAYRTMQERLGAAWAQRASDLPYASSYEALIMASMVEKETGRASDRPLVASVFVNRLRQGMRLQTDPTVIYGMGPEFEGDLRKRDLARDTTFNTYTREGLPPTPIALPGQASLQAALHPPATNYLYFVAKGDGSGSSVFSTNLSDHYRAVAKYQRGGH
jgi:UPF0755 protein